MLQINGFNVEGALTENPTVGAGKTGKPYCRFTLNVDSAKWNPNTKQEEDCKCPMQFFVSGKYAELISKVVKGANIFINGRFVPREYNDKVYVEFDVVKLAIIHSGRSSTSSTAQPATPAPKPEYKNPVAPDGSVEPIDDDIPF